MIIFHLEIGYQKHAISITVRTRCRKWIVRMHGYVRWNIDIRCIDGDQGCKVGAFRHWIRSWCPWWWDIWQCRGDELLEVLSLDCAAVFHKFLEHNRVYRWCGHLAHQWTHVNITVLRWCLNMLSTCLSTKHEVKCILLSFFICVHFRVFTVAIFHIIFHFIFWIILIIFLPNTQKWSKNETKNEPKMATMNNPIVLHTRKVIVVYIRKYYLYFSIVLHIRKPYLYFSIVLHTRQPYFYLTKNIYEGLVSDIPPPSFSSSKY